LDLRKAFGVFSHEILCKKNIKTAFLLGKHVTQVCQLLKDHIQHVNIDDCMSTAQLFNISVIQGSILRLVIFLIYINDLYSISTLLTLMFVDDRLAVINMKTWRNL
jgi:hypothetical protein